MWHEARRSERKVHDMMDAARKRALRRAVYLAKRRGDPQQSIQVMGVRSRIYRDDGLYQASQDQHGLILWNGNERVLIDRFDGRAMLDFICESGSQILLAIDKSEEERELEEFVNFERYRDLIKHRHRGCTDEEGLQHVALEIETRVATSFPSESNPHLTRPLTKKSSYSQVGFSYNRIDNGEKNCSDNDGNEEDEEEYSNEDDDFDSDDGNDEEMEVIARDFGIKKYGWLIYMDRKAKEEERRQKAVIKGDPAIRKLSRKERRKASQMERERERDGAQIMGIRMLRNDPYRESRRSPTYEAYSHSRILTSRSQSYSPSWSRHRGQIEQPDETHHSKPRTPKIEYITEFGASGERDEPKIEGCTPPLSPPQAFSNRVSGPILEALHSDPAFGLSVDKPAKFRKIAVSTSLAAVKLMKPTGGSLKQLLAEEKETPQERLKRIMRKQLSKQIKKDTAVEIAKKRDQDRQRLTRIAETSQYDRFRGRSSSSSRSYSPSPPRCCQRTRYHS